MKKEQIKSITLILLVALNVLFCSQILMGEKLWSNDYNFFSNTENSMLIRFFSVLFNKHDVTTVSKTRITVPETIIVNTGYQTTRLLLNSSRDFYNQINEDAHILLSSALKQIKTAIPIQSDEWYTALMGKSIYLSYTADFDTKLYLKLIGISDSEGSFSISKISNIVIQPLSQDIVVIYIQNRIDNTYYKMIVNDCSNTLEGTIDLVQQKVSQTHEENSMIINYSFDLFFDKAFGSQRVILDPMIPIYSTPQNYHPIISENPMIKSDGNFDQWRLDKILHMFEINSSTVRRYTESDGTLVFVENNAILKLSPNGLLDYTVRENMSGLSISNTGSYNEICGITDFMDNLNNSITAQGNFNVASVETYTNGTNISFDYIVDGLPVVFQNSDHGVYAQISDGKLQKYMQMLRTYQLRNDIYQTPEYITTLDSAIAQHIDSSETIMIQKMYIGYSDDGSIGEKYADWHIK